MKILIIKAHPSSIGHTHKIADTYKSASEALGNEVRMHDLYKTNYQLPFLSFENPRELSDSEAVQFFKSEVSWADEIVFVHPVWWHGVPAIMKNWIDTIFQAQFAFKYIEGKPVGLLKGKSAKVIATAGGPELLFTFFLSPFKITWSKMINEFCGISHKATLVCGKMSLPNSEETFNTFLKKVEALAKD